MTTGESVILGSIIVFVMLLSYYCGWKDGVKSINKRIIELHDQYCKEKAK